MIYNFYDYYQSFSTFFNSNFQFQKDIYANLTGVFKNTPLESLFSQSYANFYMLERATRVYEKLEWGISKVSIEGNVVSVDNEIVVDLPFCSLLKFSTEMNKSPIILFAPLSGHFSTLLRNTVQELLKDHTVYITDWKNASEVLLEHGEFGLDEYIDYVIEFSKFMPQGYSAVAVCQPTVPVTVAYSYMSKIGDNSSLPRTYTVMGGPMSLNGNESEVSKLGRDNDPKWFKENVIYQVPQGKVGAGRYVYPGFMQLLAFMSMNPDKHFSSHLDMYNMALDSDKNSEKLSKRDFFYDEYFAVLDMPAKFYLETLDKVFNRRLLTSDKGFSYRGERMFLSDLRGVKVFSVEGEKDDIATVGQTSDAVRLMASIPEIDKKYEVYSGVGHYGIFSGKTWANTIRPQITRFIEDAS